MNADEAAYLVQQVQTLTARLNDLQVQQAQGGRPRAKISKPDDFTGKSKELSTWLYNMALYCHSRGITDEMERIRTALPYLKGAAGTWLRGVYPTAAWAGPGPWQTWDAFTSALESTFGVIQEHLQARERLDVLRQGRNQSVTDYIQAWRLIMLELPDLAQDEVVHRFKKGLAWDRVRQYVTQATAGVAREELTFEKLAKLAKTGEMELVPLQQRSGRGGSNIHWPRTPQPAQHSRPTAMELGNVNTRERVDRDTLFRQGRCFYCKEQGHIKANCPRRQKQGNERHRQ